MNGEYHLSGHPQAGIPIEQVLDIENQQVRQLTSLIGHETSISKKLNELPLLKEKVTHAKTTISHLSPEQQKSTVKSVSVVLKTLNRADELIHELEEKEQKHLLWKSHLTDAQFFLDLIQKMSLFDLIEFRDFCISSGKRALFEEAYAIYIQSNYKKEDYPSILFTIFLDKAPVDPVVEKMGWYRQEAHSWISRGLREVLEDDPKELSPKTKGIMDAWVHSFERSAALRFNSPGDVEDLVDQIKQLGSPPNHFLIVPTRIKNHATLLLVEKQPNGNFTVVHYNTGDGIESKHKKLGDCYQTFIEVNDIPLEDIQNLDTWKSIVDCRHTSDIDVLYQTVESLTKRGQVKIYPSNPLFFSQGQYQGTCTFLSCLALMKHQLITKGGEDKVEYYLLKALLRKKMWLDVPHDPKEEKLLKLALSKVEKSGADLLLFNIASDEMEYQKAIQDFHSYNISAPATAPKDAKTRFLVLRNMTRELAAKWIKEKTLVSTIAPSLKPALLIYQDSGAIMQALEDASASILGKAKKKKPEELADMFYDFLEQYELFFTRFPQSHEKIILNTINKLPLSHQKAILQKTVSKQPFACNLVKFLGNCDFSKKIVLALIQSGKVQIMGTIKQIASFSEPAMVDFIYFHLVDKADKQAVHWVKALTLQGQFKEATDLAIHLAKKDPDRTVRLIQKTLQNQEEQSFAFANILITALLSSNSTELCYELFWDCTKLNTECAFLLADELSKKNPESALRLIKACIRSGRQTAKDLVPLLCESLARFHPAEAKGFVLELLGNNTKESKQLAISLVQKLVDNSQQVSELASDLQKINNPAKFEILKIIQPTVSKKRERGAEDYPSSKEQKVV